MVATISVGRKTAGVGVIGGAVWVAGEGRVYRIDPARNTVTASVPIGLYNFVTLAVGAFPHLIVGAGSLWLGTFIQGQGALVSPHDLRSMRAAGRPIRVHAWISHWTVGFDSLWIVSTRPSFIHRVPLCRTRWLPCWLTGA